MSSPPPRTESRRDRLRREVTAQIVDVGRAQLEAGGAGAVSWRGIAREIGMNPASLYTYVEGVEDLFTRILAQSFQRMADFVLAETTRVAARPPRERAEASARAYRTWAVNHRQEFNLLYTDQLPNYAAPADGPTAAAEVAVAEPFLAALAEAIGLDDVTALLAEPDGEPAQAVYTLRALLHGFVTLEVNHHAPYLDPDGDMMTAAMLRAFDDFVHRFS